MKSCGVATLSAYITAANRLRWLGHVGRMEEGRVPHIALFCSLHGKMTRKVGRPRNTWEKCVCADLKVLGVCESYIGKPIGTRAVPQMKMRGVGRLHVRLRVLGGRGCGILRTLGKGSG